MILESFIQIRRQKKAFAWLLDPDKCGPPVLNEVVSTAEKYAIDFFFVGGSLLFNSADQLITQLKAMTAIPVVIFPGSALQVYPQADALLLLSLISGRNPDYLIGHHVTAAPFIRSCGLEAIPTGYMLIDGGNLTAVQYISNTIPIPADKPDLALATAMAGELLGLKVIYLDAGSGAANPVPASIVRAISTSIQLPLVVGGGIRTERQANDIYEAGADVLVVGNAAENKIEVLSGLIGVRDQFNS